jgi:hypothetical protein
MRGPEWAARAQRAAPRRAATRKYMGIVARGIDADEAEYLASGRRPAAV